MPEALFGFSALYFTDIGLGLLSWKCSVCFCQPAKAKAERELLKHQRYLGSLGSIFISSCLRSFLQTRRLHVYVMQSRRPTHIMIALHVPASVHRQNSGVLATQSRPTDPMPPCREPLSRQ